MNAAVAVVADAKRALSALLAALGGYKAPYGDEIRLARERWLEELRRLDGITFGPLPGDDSGKTSGLGGLLGIVGGLSGDKNDAIDLILSTKKYARLKNRLYGIERLSMLVGGALGVVLALCKMWLVPSFILALWPISFCCAAYVISKKTFPTKNKKGK